MSPYDAYYAAIEEMESFLRRDLIGPVTEDEVIESVEPLSYYVMGILWPKRLDQQRELAPRQPEVCDGYEDEIKDTIRYDNDSITEANAYKPSAMGVSVMLPAGVQSIEATFRFGKYKMSSIEKPSGKEGQKPVKVNLYTRSAHRLPVTFAVPEQLGMVSGNNNKSAGAEVSLCLRKIMEDGSKLITVSVTNAVSAPQQTKEQNENALFQCSLQLTCAKGFLSVYQNPPFLNSEEEQISAMQSRDVRNYAYGHGCSVRYEEGGEIVRKICSEAMPSERVSQMMPNTIQEGDILRMTYWRDVDRTHACKALEAFIEEYARWRDGQRTRAKELDEKYQNAACSVLKSMETCITRLRQGVDVLRTKDEAFYAFKLMNEAMLLQRGNTKKIKDHEIDTITWYPFQLAYILQILPDITEEGSAFRDTVDLLWFPTGGGKTEAYLGVAAFAIYYRRLSRKPEKDGVTILMRYTLRLLTIQQFERASALICACESLRTQHSIPGGEISIGLWIGSGMTPNHIKGDRGALEVLNELRAEPDKRILEGKSMDQMRTLRKKQTDGECLCRGRFRRGSWVSLQRQSSPSCGQGTKGMF